MSSRWYNVAIVLLWLAAMTWLAHTKLLPPLRLGQPPSYETIVTARRREPPVGWRLDWNAKTGGWALCTTEPLPHDLTEIRSRVHFHRLPIREILPEWMSTMLGSTSPDVGELKMDAESVVIIDPLGRLSQFESAVWLEPLADPVRLRGTVEGSELNVEIRAGGQSIYSDVFQLPSGALLGDALSPQTQLPGLRQGQEWTVPMYSPIPPYQGPMEILTATVEGKERLAWGGESVDTWMVVYRSQGDSGLGGSDSVRTRLWVRRDGTVLRQETKLFGTTLTFERLHRSAAGRLYNKIENEQRGQYGWQPRLPSLFRSTEGDSPECDGDWNDDELQPPSGRPNPSNRGGRPLQPPQTRQHDAGSTPAKADTHEVDRR